MRFGGCWTRVAGASWEVTRAHKMIDRLQALGVPVEHAHVERLAGRRTAVGRPHIAAAMVEAGWAASIREAFDRWLYRGGPAYVRGEPLAGRGGAAVVGRAAYRCSLIPGASTTRR